MASPGKMIPNFCYLCGTDLVTEQKYRNHCKEQHPLIYNALLTYSPPPVNEVDAAILSTEYSTLTTHPSVPSLSLTKISTTSSVAGTKNNEEKKKNKSVAVSKYRLFGRTLLVEYSMAPPHLSNSAVAHLDLEDILANHPANVPKRFYLTQGIKNGYSKGRNKTGYKEVEVEFARVLKCRTYGRGST